MRRPRRRAPRSPIVAAALERWRECRNEFELYLEAQHARAQEDTGGALLNSRGREAGISSWSLFYGPAQRMRAYASEELLEWFAKHGRMTFEQFERAWEPGQQGEW